MANDSAQGIIKTTLARYGLGSLAEWAWMRYQSGDSFEEILLSMRDTKEYKARFPAMDQLAREGRAISEEAYLSYEQGLRGLLSQHGLSQDIYARPDYVAKLLTGGVTLVEAQARMALASAASTTAPPEYREEFRRIYGGSVGDWTSIWMETETALPELEKKFAAASVAGEATLASLGDLSRTMAERLVEAGITREQARQGLTRASYELTARLPGEVEAGLGTDTTVAGAVGIGQASEQFERRVRQRLAAFAAGGSAAITQTGVTGLGSTQR